jgi:hypothetical protein
MFEGFDHRSTGFLGGVVGIDADVLVREITGDEAAAARTLAEVDRDSVFACGHNLMGCGFVIFGGANAVGEYRQISDAYGDCCRIEGDSSAPGGGKQAAPVGICRGPGGLAKGRGGDGLGDDFRVRVGLRAGNVERDDVRNAFAVIDDGVGQLVTDALQRSLECGDMNVLRGHFALAAGEQQHGVVGGHIAIDGDAVEAGIDRSVQHRLQVCGFGGEVGEEIDEHRGMRHELGADHARALCTAEDIYLFAAERDCLVGDFQLRIGGEDRGGKGFGVFDVVAQRSFRCGNRGEEFFHRQRHADDAGRRGNHLIEDTAEPVCDFDAAFARGLDARFAGGAVGIACVDEYGGDFAVGCFQMRAANGDGRSDELIGGETGCGGSAAFAHGERDIGLAAGFDAGFDCGPAEAEGEVFFGAHEGLSIATKR